MAQTQNQRVLEAASAAWPDDGSALARFRRRVALELANIENGPYGPHSCLAARLSSTMRVKHPALTEEVCRFCSPPGKMRLRQLLSPGPGEDTLSCANDATLEDPYGGAFLYWRQGQYDMVAVLDVIGLLSWHGAGGPNTPPNGPSSFAGQRGGFRSGGVRPPARLPYYGGGEVNIDLSGIVPRYGTPGADLLSPYCTNLREHSGAAAAGDGDAHEGMIAVSNLVDLGYMAFPGPSPANQLRRSLVGCLAAVKQETTGGGLPPYTVPWRQLAPMVTASRAATLYPTLSKPATFRAFLQHPASAGVFAATRILRNSADPTSHVDCVTLSTAALRRAAPMGFAAAVAAAWPGNGTWPQLKRAAAEVLLRASPPTGHFTLSSGPLGNLLKMRRPLQYGVARGEAGGLMQKLDESAFQGFLVYVREDGKEGYLQLKFHALVRKFPPDDGRDLGLSLAEPQAPPAPAGAVAGNPVATSAAMDNMNPAVPPLPAVSAAAHSTAAPIRTDGANGQGSSALPVATTGPELEARPDVTGNPRDFSTDDGGAFDTWSSNIPPPPLPFPTVHAAPPASVPGAQMQAQAPAQPQVQSQSNAIVTAQDVYDIGHRAPPSSTVPATAFAAQTLVSPAIQWARLSSELEAALQHCYCAASIGLAVHVTKGGGAAVVALYAPTAAEAAEALDVNGAQQLAATWPTTIYLIDCTALARDGVMPGGAAAVRALLESAYVAKVVHGCEQVAALAASCGAITISPLLDIRVLLSAVCAMLPALPPLPPPPPSYGAVGPLAAVTMAKLNAHVAALREELGKTGLWGERPDLMAALVARHTAALREDLFGSREWTSNPVAHEAALVAAARHLPEIWDALSYEAIPWVAMAAAATATAAALERQHRSPAGSQSSGGGAVPTFITATAAAPSEPLPPLPLGGLPTPVPVPAL